MDHHFSRTLRICSALGIVLMRVAIAATIAFRRPWAHWSELLMALLLLGGVWTPAVASCIALVELWRTTTDSGGLASLLLAAMATAVALVGPGAWSLDARYFGWHRIEIPGPERGEAVDRSDRSGRSFGVAAPRGIAHTARVETATTNAGLDPSARTSGAEAAGDRPEASVPGRLERDLLKP